jgi:succinate dehydrogenase/fumarate reductase iron-sulfur protein
MKIDGKVRLACYTPAEGGHSVEPLPGFKVVRDLVVDWKPYEDRLYGLVPPLSQTGAEPLAEATEKDRELAEGAMTCIRCFACVGVCPSVDLKTLSGFAGPAISVMLTTFVDDGSRRRTLAESILKAGLEFCTKCYACNAVCPAEIDIVGSINKLQRISAAEGSEGKHLAEMVQGRF